MAERRSRYRWQVEYPNGERAWLRRLASVRRDVGTVAGDGRPVTLTRLGRHRYYFVQTWSNGNGLVAALVLVTRVTATRAELEMREQQLRFELTPPANDWERLRRGV